MTTNLSDLARITAIVRRLLSSKAFDHEDIAMAIMIESWENDVEVPTYAFVRFRCQDILRSWLREQALLARVAARDVVIHDSVEDSEAKVAGLVATLDSLERKIVWYKFYEGLSNESIAKATGESVLAIRETLARALFKMKQQGETP